MKIDVILSESEAKSAVMYYIQEVFGEKVFGGDIPDLPINNIIIEKDTDDK